MVVPSVMGKSFSITSVTRFSRSTSSFYFYFLFIFFFIFFIDLFILSNRMTKVTPFETWSVTLQNDTNKGIEFEEDPRIVVEFKTTGILSTPSDMNPALAMSSSPSSSGTLPSTSPSPFPSVNLSSASLFNPIYVIYSRRGVTLCRTLCGKERCTLAIIVSKFYFHYIHIHQYDITFCVFFWFFFFFLISCKNSICDEGMGLRALHGSEQGQQYSWTPVSFTPCLLLDLFVCS